MNKLLLLDGKRAKIIGSTLVIFGSAFVIYLLKTLADRGLAADKNGTAGYTTNSEIALGILGLAAIIIGLVIYFRDYKTSK